MDNKPLYIVPDSLVAENIFLSVGRKDILKGATIRADKGKITGLLGRNGAGKTTTLQSIYGTGKAQECDVFLNGRKIKRAYAVKSLVNYLPQKPFLPKSFLMKEIAMQYGIDLKMILSCFPDLETDVDKKMDDLSGGIQRLWSVIVILLAKTRFSFLDEPFTHIMPLHVEQLKALLVKQKEKKGIIITDHMYRHLLGVSNQIYLMKEGKSIYIKDRDDLVLHGYVNSITD
jgi:lipopolysaccharide export system ATP-binding protein